MTTQWEGSGTALVAVAHPDDIEAMLAFAASQASDVLAVVATDGEASTVDRVGDGFVRNRGRRDESYAGLGHLGIAADRQQYLGLPDGELANHVPAMQGRIADYLASYAVDTVITLGESGYDGHPDHVAAHQAAMTAALSMRPSGRPNIMSLNRDHLGQRLVKGSPSSKLASMGYHSSQFDLDNPGFWSGFLSYMPLLLAGETYDVLLPPDYSRMVQPDAITPPAPAGMPQ